MPILIFFFLLGLLLLVIGGRAWFATGLPDTQIVAADMGEALPGRKALVSHRHGLTGKPDYLVRISGGIAPVEVKSGRIPRTGRPHADNRMQLAAYCLLVEDTLQTNVPYGIIKYLDGSIRIPFTDSEKRQLLSVLDRIRAAKETTDCQRSHREPARCAHCGYRWACPEAL